MSRGGFIEDPPAARLIGALVLGSAAIVGLVLAAEWRVRRHESARMAPADSRGRSTAVSRLQASSALLSLAVLADSAVEHARGFYENPGMYTPVATAALGIVA